MLGPRWKDTDIKASRMGNSLLDEIFRSRRHQAAGMAYSVFAEQHSLAQENLNEFREFMLSRVTHLYSETA